MGLGVRKLWADQPAHTRRLINTFVIYIFESTISELASGEIPIFLLVSVVEEIDFSLALLGNPKTCFVAWKLKYHCSTGLLIYSRLFGTELCP